MPALEFCPQFLSEQKVINVETLEAGDQKGKKPQQRTSHILQFPFQATHNQQVILIL